MFSLCHPWFTTTNLSLYVSYSWNFRHRLVRLYWYNVRSICMPNIPSTTFTIPNQKPPPIQQSQAPLVFFWVTLAPMACPSPTGQWVVWDMKIPGTFHYPDAQCMACLPTFGIGKYTVHWVSGLCCLVNSDPYNGLLVLSLLFTMAWW